MLGLASRTGRVILAWAALGAAFGAYLLGARLRALKLACKIHSSGFSDSAAHAIEAALRRVYALDRTHPSWRRFSEVCDQSLQFVGVDSRIDAFRKDPTRLFKARAIVLKRGTGGEKGVLLLDYSFTFPLFASLFDVEAIAQRYYFVLEPSWCGFCSLDILYYSLFAFPVYVLSGEPRDTAFLQGIRSNLVPIPAGGNWWVDHRVFRPLPDVKKDVDVVIVAAWARYKEHGEVFKALSRIVQQGHHPKTLLIGYDGDLDRVEILRRAREAGIEQLLEVHESLSPEQVNYHLNRARVNILWSRKEGFNRAIIEGMFAGVPCIVRTGHNFGYQYPYVNPLTGIYATNENLPDRILQMIRDSHLFAPREWVERMMSCEAGAGLMNAEIRQRAHARGEPWTSDLVVKTVSLHGMSYWKNEDESAFQADYEFIEKQLRRS